MKRRSTLKPVEAKVLPVQPRKYRCASCGVGIPKLDRPPYICSYCAKDPTYGRDGYLEDMLQEAVARHPTLNPHVVRRRAMVGLTGWDGGADFK